jgi:hypothetical protein
MQKSPQTLVNALAPLCVLACLAALASPARAQQTINTAVTGPQYGDGGTFTITSAGSVTNNAGNAVTSTTGSAITTFVNDGGAVASNYALFNDATSMTGIVNSGSMYGYFAGLYSTGTIGTFTSQSTGSISAWNWPVIVIGPGSGIGSLTNSGAIVNTGGGRAIHLEDRSVIGTLTNTVSGTIQGGYSDGIGVFNSQLGTLNNAGSITGPDRGISISGSIASITTIVNSGTVSGGGTALYQDGTLGSLDNSGSMSSGYIGVVLLGTTGTITNQAGATITGNDRGISNTGSLTTLTNSGTVYGGATGVEQAGGTLTTLTNSGRIEGTTWAGVLANGGPLTSLANSGDILGGGIGVRTEYQTIGTITNGTTGLIQGSTYDGIQNVAGTITTIDNYGVVNGVGRSGIRNEEYFGNAHIGTITNRAGASVSGAENGIAIIDNFTGGAVTIDSISNSGTVSGGVIGVVVYGYPSTLGSLDNSGRIEGGTRYGVQVDGGTITTLTNSGTIVGDWNGVRTDHEGTIGTITNGTTGTIQGTQYDGIINVGGEMTTIDNSGVINGPGRSGILNADYLANAHVGTITNRAGGSISGGSEGIYNMQAFGNTSTIDSIVNSGTVSGGAYGVQNEGTLTTLTNAGMVGGGDRGVRNQGTLTTLTNSGTVSGGDVGVENLGGSIGTITNQAGGTIASSGYYGVYLNGGSVGTLANSGVISGAYAGVGADAGTLTTLTNSGTISYTGAGNGPAILVGPNVVFGDPTGAGGPALTSTGSGALLNGTIVNSGTIHHGFTIENQSVTVSAGGWSGAFISGALAVADGDLTLTSGTIALGADVAVNQGGGTVTNDAVLAVLGLRSIGGSFSQSAGATLAPIISGSAAYGGLLIDGAATFAGGLNLYLDEFLLAGGQAFNLLAFDSFTGGFSGLSVDGVALTSVGSNQWAYDSLILQENWTPTSMSITVAAVPEPSTYCMALAGLACGGYSIFRRRKRA